MTDSDFSAQLINMRDTMYRVSCSQLFSGADREDAVQETLLKAWQGRHRLKNDGYMQTWVIKILINECHNIQRRQKRESHDPPPEGGYLPPDVLQLREALMALDSKLRLPVVLHYIEGFTTAEIASMLKVPKGTVLWRLSKAREKLGAWLSDDDNLFAPVEEHRQKT